jgi:hypothetical protein
MAEDEGQKKKRTPFSVRLPQAPINEVIPVVEALAALGTPSSPHVIAQQAGTSYGTDARFRTRLAAAGYYGFMAKDGNLRKITSRGEALVGDDEAAAKKARREAVMSTNFGPIIHSLRGRSVSEDTVALRVESDYGVPKSSAPGVAKVLVTSATEAELMADGRLDAAAIEQLAGLMPSPHEVTQTNGAKPRQRKAAEQKSTAARAGEDAKKQTTATTETGEKDREEQPPPFVQGVQVVVNIDASDLTPAQIAELVRALQAPRTAS